MKKLILKLKELDIDLIFGEFKCDGFCIPSKRVIFVRMNLSEFDMKSVIRHELKHILDHDELLHLYRDSFIYHSKTEFEANDYMIKETIEEYENEFNYSAIIQDFGIGMGYEELYLAQKQS